MKKEDTYWIPGLGQNEHKELTLSDIGLILRGSLHSAKNANAMSVKGRLSAALNALSITSEMVRVRAGSFKMGHTREDRVEDAIHLGFFSHLVTLTYDYWIGRYPVTCQEYDCFCESIGKAKPRDPFEENEWVPRRYFPVGYLKWGDAVRYCNWLSLREGLKPAFDFDGNLLDTNGNITTEIKNVEGYRLPTEAEWEYAARGGHKRTRDYRFPGTDDLEDLLIPYYDDKPLGQTKPNDLGLFDMSGTIWEWCYDRYFDYTNSTERVDPIGPTKGRARVIRGCGLDVNYALDRGREIEFNVAYRYESPPISRRSGLRTGFRVARTCDWARGDGQEPAERKFVIPRKQRSHKGHRGHGVKKEIPLEF